VEAATVHERVAEVLDEYGKSKRAQAHRGTAEQDRDAAVRAEHGAEKE
jgi:hypothetical protein